MATTLVTSTDTPVGVYLRQSLDTSGDELAISRQREECLKLCRAKGWTSVTEYVDNDRSATNGKKRPAYQLMLADIAAGKVGAVVVLDLDRLHRQPIELEQFMKLADQKRLALATCTGDVDLATDNGRLFARIKGAVGMAEVERKGVRQKLALDQRARDGHAWWTSRPFGYDADPDPDHGGWWTARRPTKHSSTVFNTIRLHVVEAPLVQAAYVAVLKGDSLHSIAAGWNKAGVKPPRGTKWRGAQVRQLLLAERNAGLRHSPDRPDEYIAGNWPPIVTEDMWRGVCGILANPARRYCGSRARKHLLSGIAICGKCKGLLTSGVTTGTKHRNYRCIHCRGIARDAVMVDAMVVEAVVNRLSRADAVELLIDLTRDDIDKLQADVDALRAQIKTAEDEYDDGVIDGVRLAARKERVNVKLRPLVARMQDRERAEVFADLPLGTPEVDAAFDALSLDRRRRIIRALLTVTINSTTSGRTFLRKDVDVVLPDRRAV